MIFDLIDILWQILVNIYKKILLFFVPMNVVVVVEMFEGRISQMKEVCE